MNKYAIIFDVDGTLVDITESYAQTVILTSYIYCDKILGIRNLPKLSNWFTNDFYVDLKKISGFNSDYLCTVVFIDFLLLQLQTTTFSTTKIPFTTCSFFELKVSSLIHLQREWNDYLDKYFRNNDIEPDKIIGQSKYKKLIKDIGSIDDSNYIERIFQEVYYGSEKFFDYYGLPSKYYKEKTGLYTKDMLLIPYHLLDRLQEQNIPLGIFTGRPRSDLDLLFDNFSLSKYFESKYIITLTDIIEEEKRLQEPGKLSKPNPWGLLKLKTYMPSGIEKIFMIGDSPDDLQAALKAKVIPIHFTIVPDATLNMGFEFKSFSDWDRLNEILK